MNEPTHKSHIDTLKRLRKDLDTKLTCEEKAAFDYIVNKEKRYLSVQSAIQLVLALIKLYFHL
ncbi:hypothetical protein DU976_20790 [Vibrio navarrensis]|nr:hypothetical protein [Vibrio navarrensis]ODW50585.1 hypothetical protein BBL88_17830 [Vibrio parahaemolyticus]